MRLYQNNISSEDKLETAKFSKWILHIGNGIVEGIKDVENEDARWIKIPENFILYYDSNPIEKISHSIYDDFIDNFMNID